MSTLSPFAIFMRHWQGLSDPRNGHGGEPYRWTRRLLYGIPAAVLAVAYWRSWDLDDVASSLLGGFALAAGVLIAVFTQLAAWRSRLDERAAVRPDSEAPARRSVDAAVAHALVGVLACIFSAAVIVTLEAGGEPARLWSAIASGLGVYVLGLFLLIVRSVFVGYESNVDPAVREADVERARPPKPLEMQATRP